MKKRFIIATLFLLLSGTVECQTVNNKTTASCSPIVANNQGTLDIHCSGLNPEIAKQLAKLVEQVAAMRDELATESTQKQILQILVSREEDLTELRKTLPVHLFTSSAKKEAFALSLQRQAQRISIPSLIDIQYTYLYEQDANQLKQILESSGLHVEPLVRTELLTCLARTTGLSFNVVNRDNAQTAYAIASSLHEAGIVNTVTVGVKVDTPGNSQLSICFSPHP